MTFGEKLRKLRTDRKISQQDLAQKAGLSQTAIYYWEKGERKPKIEQLRKIATVLGVHISDLVDDWNNFSYEEITNDWEQNKEPFEELSTLVIKGHKDTISDLLDLMNDAGQDKAIEQVELLTKIQEYRKEE